MKAVAIRKSMVLFSKPDDGKDYGNRVYLQHDDGHVSMYAHLESINVKTGQTLNPGDIVGEIGDTGYCPSGSHLHYSLFPIDCPSLFAANTCNPTKYLEANGYPCDTEITNHYGSNTCNPRLSGHEGIDFSSWRLRDE
jgi:murein DD-endopeptidase MepM/ murein hydrolase activator NlpD